MRLPRVSAVILNLDGSDLLPDILESLFEQAHADLEILVGDNGSSDASEQVVALYPGVRFVPLGRNLGFARGNNETCRQASGDYIFFLNNDMRLEPDCIPALVTALEADSRVFAADARQLDWEGKLSLHGLYDLRRVSTPFTNFLPFLSLEQDHACRVQTPTPQGCAGNLMVRRSHFEALGGFDPWFFADFEDTDLCWRAWLRGWATYYVPEAVVRHRVAMTRARVDRSRLLRSGAANLLAFAVKIMPLRMVGLLAAVYLLRSGHSLAARGDRVLAAAHAGAVKDILRRWPALTQERRHIQARSVIRADDLIEAFTGGASEGLIAIQGQTDSI